MYKILTILGTRPNFVKASPVSEALRENGISEIIVNTGQHYDFNMSDIFFKELNIPKSEYDLDVGSDSHANQTGAILSKLDDILIKENPDALLVYGDTNTTLGGALVAVKLQISIIHVEAGLRSFNRKMPEEINRVITDHISTILFCPSNISKENLKHEGIDKNVFIVGDVMYDIFKKWESRFESKNRHGDYALLTMHRAENTVPDILRQRLTQLSKIDLQIIYPIHPRTKKIISQNKIILPKNIKTIDPLGWLDLMRLCHNARFIITDSGGLQKEALWLKKHCLTIREETEWLETVQQGVNHLVKVDENISIPDLTKGDFTNPYGNGDASKKIAEVLKSGFE